MLINKVLTSV